MSWPLMNLIAQVVLLVLMLVAMSIQSRIWHWTKVANQAQKALNDAQLQFNQAMSRKSRELEARLTYLEQTLQTSQAQHPYLKMLPGPKDIVH